MDTILASLDKLEDILEESRKVPLSNKVSVDKDQIYEIIDDIRLNIPQEIRKAQRILTECEKILKDAEAKAENIVRSAEQTAEQMLTEHEITKQANELAKQNYDEGKRQTREMYQNAREYADDILEKTEKALQVAMNNIITQSREAEEFLSDTINVIYSNRQELRSVAMKKEDGK